jgi:flagellar biosynthesis protein
VSASPYKDKVAVALRYDAPNAPVVVASGRGFMGQRIVEAAQAHGVPLERNPALAQALSTIELDAAIPERLYTAVAEILAFLLRAAEDQTPDADPT